MQIYPVNNFQTNIRHTSFGTELGPRLTDHLEKNKAHIAFHQLVNIKKLKRNGLNDTILELEDNGNKGFNLVLTGKVFDRKDEIMNDSEFRRWRRIRNNTSDFPVKNVISCQNGVLVDSVIQQFNTDYLNRNVKSEYDFAKRVNRYYNLYKE